MNRLAKLIETMPREDLQLLLKDLEAGNLHKLIQRRLAELEPEKHCPVCGRALERGNQKFSLEFGPADLRKRAYFDEEDCLQYFLRTLRSHDSEVHNH